MSDAEASKGGLERATFLRGRRGEPLAERARRGVHADLAARFPVDEGEVADVGQDVLARIADLDDEDVVACGGGREGQLPVARAAKIGDEDDEAAARGDTVDEGERVSGRDRAVGSGRGV